MTGVSQSLTNLIAELDGVYATGQAAGAITAARVRQASEDFAESVVSWDDGNNTSGLGAPAILRGTVSTYNLSGLTTGAGLSTAVRTANATALQNAINYAAANKKWFELDRQNYEIASSTGLQVPASANSFHWRGNGSAIIQCASNAPVITFGDAVGNTQASGFDIDGVNAQYGVDQTGQTGATAIILGPMWLGKYSNLLVDGLSLGHPPYQGISVVGRGTFFSNRISDTSVINCQNSFLNIQNLSTQNVWTRTHLTQGGFSSVAIGNTVMSVSNYPSGDASNGTTFDGLNIEHCLLGGKQLMDLVGARGINMQNVHFENCGGTYAFFHLLDASLTLTAVDFLNCRWLTADGFSTGQVINASDGSRVNATGVLMQWTSGGLVDSNFSFYGGLSANTPGACTVRGMEMKDFGGNNIQSHFSMDTNLTAADYPAPNRLTDYEFGPFYSYLEKAEVSLTGTFTHHGQSRNAYLIYPASLAASCTLTLSNTMRSGSPGASVPRLVGDTVMLLRNSGTAANTLTVKDGSGTTLTTNTTAATAYTYVYNGTNFVAVT